MNPRRLRVLCNPTAGGGRGARSLASVERALSGGGAEVVLERTESGAHAERIARAAAEAGEEVVAFGGDGMVRIAAHAVRGTDAVLGILPGGRGNDFARALGIPRDPVAACEALLDGEVRRIDVGDVDDETFLGVASIGIESEVTRIANAAPRIGGRATYAVAALLGLARWRPAMFELELDGEPRELTGYLVGVANSGRFGGGMRLAPDARLDDGMLDVVMVRDAPKRGFLGAMRRLFKGTHVDLDAVEVVRAQEVRLAADRPFEVYADGDEIARTPALARVVPKALQVRAPRLRR